MSRLAALLITLCALLALPARAERPVTIFAAASLQDVLADVAQNAGIAARFSFGGSGQIARQVAAGAPADVVVLASPVWMTWLETQGVVAPGRAVPVAANGLVLIGAADTAPLGALSGLPALLGRDRLAMGHRDAVPAGVYARQWLTAAGVWPTLEDQLAETDSVRAALALVARGQTPFGIVYATDAAPTPLVGVVLRPPAGAHDPILYPAAALTEAGEAFLAALTTADAKTVFAAHGFLPVPE